MRVFTGIFFGVTIAACRQATPPPDPIPNPVPQSVIVSAAVAAVPAPVNAPPPAPAAPATPVAPTAATSKIIDGITFEGVAFDSRRHRLAVVDQSDGPGSRHADAASAARAIGGIAAINASFFSPEGKPLGLVVGGGQSAGAWNSRSSLGSGVWHEDPSGTAAISRRENLGSGRARTMSELIQSGPMLVENGRGVGGLEGARTAVRSLIAWDGGTRWWIGRTSTCTLAELSKALANGNPAGWPVRHALNLDGGRSSDLWISGAISGGPLTRRPAWNRPVRNFLVLMP